MTSNLRPLISSLTTLFVLGASVFSANALACSSCGCTLSSDWAAQGYAARAGLRLDLRYDFFDQDQLRFESHAVSRSSLEVPNEAEIQKRTLNRNTTLSLDYSTNPNWGVALQVPFYNRYHQTIGEGDEVISTSHTDSIGDIRVLVRYQGFSHEHNTGIQFGLKLPSGNSHEKFSSGPLDGEEIDKGLQPGTGSNDILMGAYHFGNLIQNWDYFSQALLQKAISSRDEFTPSASVNANIGVRYLGFRRYTPHIQLNARVEGRESGENSDRENSGSKFIYISPGVTTSVSDNLKLYGFYQAPIYQHVNGIQIDPRYFLSVGVQYKF